jgi:hypothetical protein
MPMTTAALRWLLVVAVVAPLAWAAVGLARVDTGWGAPTGPDRLLQAVDADPVLQAGDVAVAERILRQRPIDGRAFRVLAQHADAAGDHARADALYAIAVRLAPRDRLTRAALADRAFAAGDLAAALQQLDALWRVAPQMRAPLLRVLPLGDVRVRAALIDRLALQPPWRDALRSVLLDPATPAANAAHLLDELAARTPLTEAEQGARIVLLQRLGRAPEARRLWLASVGQPASGVVPLVFDGGFEQPDIRDGYGWRQSPPPGVAFIDDDRETAEGKHALAIEFEGRAVTTPGLEQALALPPGDYALSTAADNRTDAQRPFAWTLRCQDGGTLLLTLPLPDASTDGWQQVRDRFNVPASCHGQLLRLDYLGRSLDERQFSGSLRIDAVRVSSD